MEVGILPIIGFKFNKILDKTKVIYIIKIIHWVLSSQISYVLEKIIGITSYGRVEIGFGLSRLRGRLLYTPRDLLPIIFFQKLKCYCFL